MLRVIIVGIITTALVVAIAITFREDVGLRWFGPDFIAPGADLPEAKLGEKPPAAPVIHVSNKWVTSRGKRIVSADEAISDPDFLTERLLEEVAVCARGGVLSVPYDCCRFSRRWNSYLKTYERDTVSGIPDGIIVQVDEGVEFGLLKPVLYTCIMAHYVKWHLAAINGESGDLEVITVRPLALPYPCPDGIWGVGAGPISGISPTFIEREGVNGLELGYKPIPESEEALGGDVQYAVVLYVGEDWFLLPDSEAGATVVLRNAAGNEYSLLAEKLRQIKRRYPKQRCLIIACNAHVKYEELVRVFEVAVQPEIALTEIYLASIEGLRKIE